MWGPSAAAAGFGDGGDGVVEEPDHVRGVQGADVGGGDPAGAAVGEFEGFVGEGGGVGAAGVVEEGSEDDPFAGVGVAGEGQDGLVADAAAGAGVVGAGVGVAALRGEFAGGCVEALTGSAGVGGEEGFDPGGVRHHPRVARFNS